MNDKERRQRLLFIYGLVFVSMGLAITVTAFLPITGEVRLLIGAGLIGLGYATSKFPV